MFSNFLRSLEISSTALEELLQSKTAIEYFNQNEVIIKQGQICENLYFIEQGLTRGFHIDETGKDITNWFAPENTLATSAYSFISQNPSFESVMALEDCKMHVISRKDIYGLYENYPLLNETGRKMIEIYYLGLEERLNGLQFHTAKKRYANF